MNIIIYLSLLSVSCGYALWRGDRDARSAAMVCIVATGMTVVLLTPGSTRYGLVETGVMAVDVATLGAFVVLALFSQRFWPLWVAGLQMTASAAHALKFIDNALVPLAYAVAERFWGYPILIIIGFGAFRGHRRRAASALRLADA